MKLQARDDTRMEPKATVVVGLDFGTVYSGFAYALRSAPQEIRKFYDWPSLKASGGQNYCKTLTSLLYGTGRRRGSYVIKEWGYCAAAEYARGKHSQTGQRSCGDISPHRQVDDEPFYVTSVPLLLFDDGGTFVHDLPEGITARRAVSDYLAKMSETIMEVLKGSIGSSITMKHVQWCITVPATWSKKLRDEMEKCAQMAGLVELKGITFSNKDASPHPLLIVPEPEVASLYCQQAVEYPLNHGDKLLLVDIGGRTVDISILQKVGPPSCLKVRQAAPSISGLCGGMHLDKRFFEFLSQKIASFPKFMDEQPNTALTIKGWWETTKCAFDGSMHFPYELELPAKLARAWEEEECRTPNGREKTFDDSCYDAIMFSLDDMEHIFDPVVNQVVDLIDKRMTPQLKALIIVGGLSASPYFVNKIKNKFSKRVGAIIIPKDPGSASPYFVNKIKNKFSKRVGAIIIPKDPGSAVCCGAVSYGLGWPDHIVSRISNRTYGISSARPFARGDPLHSLIRGMKGGVFCEEFLIFTRKGDEVPLNHSAIRTIYPVSNCQTQSTVSLYSSSDLHPRFTTDGSNVRKESSICITHPSREELGACPVIVVSLHFGNATVVATARGKNFGELGKSFVMPTVVFDKSFSRGDRTVGLNLTSVGSSGKSSIPIYCTHPPYLRNGTEIQFTTL